MAQSVQGSGVEITVEELEAELTAGSVRVLDVREDHEWRSGHLAGAIHIPLGQLAQRTPELPIGEPLAVICAHGNRSLVAAHYLLARGYPGTTSVSGGTVAWARSGRPLARE